MRSKVPGKIPEHLRGLPLANREGLRKLLERLGDRLPQIVRRFYAAMAQDVLVGFFFTGRDLDAIADRQTEFLRAAAGLVPDYAGKTPSEAHAALPPILPGHFDRRLMLLEQTLNAEKLAPADIATWVAFENAFRSAVISTPSK